MASAAAPADQGEQGAGPYGLLGWKQAAEHHYQRHPGGGRQPGDGPADDQPVHTLGAAQSPRAQPGQGQADEDEWLTPTHPIGSDPQRQPYDHLP